MAAQNLKIANLENAPAPVLVIPQSTAICSLAPGQYDVNILLDAVETKFCELMAAVGSPALISENLADQPAGIDTKLCFPGTFSGDPRWSASPGTLADSVGNIWLVIEDLRCAIRNIQLNCCPTGCDDLKLQLYCTLTGSVIRFYVTGTVPAGFAPCSNLGITFTIAVDAGGSITITVPITVNDPAGTQYDLLGTPLAGSLSSDMTITSVACYRNDNTSTECERFLQYRLINTAICPSVLLNSTQSSITYSFYSTVGLKTYSVELWNADGSVMLTNYVHTTNGLVFVTGTFSGLTPSTVYKVKVTITVGTSVVYCQFNVVTTAPPACPPATTVNAVITIP